MKYVTHLIGQWKVAIRSSVFRRYDVKSWKDVNGTRRWRQIHVNYMYLMSSARYVDIISWFDVISSEDTRAFCNFSLSNQMRYILHVLQGHWSARGNEPVYRLPSAFDLIWFRFLISKIAQNFQKINKTSPPVYLAIESTYRIKPANPSIEAKSSYSFPNFSFALK